MFLGSFLAPQRNRRADRYRGTSVEGRIRVVLEALGAIRGEVGADFPVTLRISGYERVAAGRPVHDTATIAPLLVEAGVDAFHVSGGVIDRLVTGMVNAADAGDGLNVGAAAAVKEAVDVPVIAVGRLHDPVLAEAVLADGRADFVAMGRPLLADPDLPRKLAAGEAGAGAAVHLVRELHRHARGEARDRVRGQPVHRARARAGGAQGSAARDGWWWSVAARPVLEAARLADLAGHDVVLLERAERLGGALVAASAVHRENRPYLDWLLAEVGRSGVDVRLRAVATVDAVADLAPDVVVVATGGTLVVPPIPGDQLAHVSRGLDPDRLPLGRRVVVVGGRLAAVEYAETLAADGRLVALLEPGPEIAPEFGLKRRTEHFDRIDRLGITVHVGCSVEEITAGGVRYAPAHGTSRVLAADAVVLAGTVVADLTLSKSIAARLPDTAVHTIGDAALGPGLIRGATATAAQVVQGIG